MSEGVTTVFRRNAFRFALTGLVGIWLSGCADATRFSESPNPFSNPFSTASNDSVAPTPRVSSRPLASAKPYNRSYAAAARPSPVAVAAAPAPSLASTGAIRAGAQPVGGSAAGWSAVGGSPIVVGPADDASTLSARYGVPEAALLSANGLHSRSDIRPNMRIVVPVFNARGGGGERTASESDRHDREAHDKLRHADRREADGEDSNKRRSADSDRKERKKHKAEARRGDDDAQADDGGDEKKVAKVEKPKNDEKLTKHDKHEKLAKQEKLDKHAKDTARAEAPTRQQTEVAKAEPARPHKAEVDKAPTGNVAAASAGSSESNDLRWPARGRIIQGFKVGGNDGINIALPEGTSVRAAEDGKVAYAGSALKGYGNLVLIRHSNGLVTAYANNGELDVKSGDSVKRGQVIAKSGQTGDVSTPQLHFEVRKGQTPVDPTGFLAGL